MVVDGGVRLRAVRRSRSPTLGRESGCHRHLCQSAPPADLHRAEDMVELMLDGRQPEGLRLSEMLGNGPIAWEGAADRLGLCGSAMVTRLQALRVL